MHLFQSQWGVSASEVLRLMHQQLIWRNESFGSVLISSLEVIRILLQLAAAPLQGTGVVKLHTKLSTSHICQFWVCQQQFSRVLELSTNSANDNKTRIIPQLHLRGESSRMVN